MKHFRVAFIYLIGRYLIFSEDHNGCCLDIVGQAPMPRVRHLLAISDEQNLVVSWLVGSGSVGGIHEIQISRAENQTVIYSENVSAPSADSPGYKWTWTSELPLECVDHSVRVRHFDNRSLPSPWSEWVTNYGVEAEEKTKMFPFQRVLREGTNATFCCVPPAGVNITGITLKERSYPLVSVGARVKAIAVANLHMPTYINALTLQCSDTTGNGNYAWNYVSFPSQKPANLSCATSHMTAVTCTWDPGRKRDPGDRNHQTHTLHIRNSDQAPISCEPSSCTFSAIPHLEEYVIAVVVQDTLGAETESYSFNISDRVFPVAEWDSVSPGVTDTTVSWIVQGNLTQLNLLCQVAVETGSTTELNCKGVAGPYEVKLEHLLPNTRYSTRARCSVGGRLWGKWTQPLSFTTHPLVTLNLWRRVTPLSDPHRRQVTLLWTLDVPGSATSVTIQGYTVQWSEGGHRRSEWKDGGQTQAVVSVGPGQYVFAVEALLRAGSSVPDNITIPKLDLSEKLPEEKRLSSSSAGGFNLSWIGQDTATCGYAVEWCILGIAVPCTLRWKKVLQGNHALFLPAGHFRAGRRYTFDIYACMKNGHRLLEIQTGYSQELEAVPPPRLVEPVHITCSAVTLEWRYKEDDPSHPAFITGYLVTGQEVGSNMRLDLTAVDMFNLSVADPRRKALNVEGLKQGHEYTFSVSALTKYGPGQPVNISFRTTTNSSAQLAKTLASILILLACTFLLCSQGQLLKRRLTEIFVYPAGMGIKTSEFDRFLQKTGERVLSHKLEECVGCDIEILHSTPLYQTTALGDPESLDTSPPPGSQPPRGPIKDYCPQPVTLHLQGPAPSTRYFPSVAEDFPEQPEVADGEIKSSTEPTEYLQPSCSVVYGYISVDTLQI